MIKEPQRRDPITGWWETVPHPKWVSVLHTLCYAAFAIAGVIVLVDPPQFLQVGFGAFLTVYWAWLLVVGGVVGTFVVFPGLYIVERFSLGACAIAVAMHGVALAGLDRIVESNLVYYQIFNWILFALLLVRALRIWHGVRDPEQYSTYRHPTRRRYTA